MHQSAVDLPVAFPTRALAPLPGHGELEFTRVNGRTAVTRAMASSPLRLLTPRGHGMSARVFTSTFGGGLVAGDTIALTVRAGAGTACILGTQASTKVYRSPAGIPSSQRILLIAEEGATCVVAPDPVTCFAGAVYEQRQSIQLHAGASLLMIDWLTSGRRARGERWAFDRYQTCTDIAVGGRVIFRDALRLDAADGAVGAEHRMGRCDCMGLAILIGPRMERPAANLLEWVQSRPVTPGENLIFSASPLPGGAVLRAAGPTTEAVGRWFRERLSFASELLGDDPWARKW
ncbi:MAG: ureD [Phycisphaerales bacterium]|jgi:urease accessory protein|nr:ureD [Phycisphaerales bacterium]